MRFNAMRMCIIVSILLVSQVDCGEECSVVISDKTITKYCEFGGCCTATEGRSRFTEDIDLCCLNVLTITLISVFVGLPLLILFCVCCACSVKYCKNRNHTPPLEQTYHRPPNSITVVPHEHSNGEVDSQKSGLVTADQVRLERRAPRITERREGQRNQSQTTPVYTRIGRYETTDTLVTPFSISKPTISSTENTSSYKRRSEQSNGLYNMQGSQSEVFGLPDSNNGQHGNIPKENENLTRIAKDESPTKIVSVNTNIARSSNGQLEQHKRSRGTVSVESATHTDQSECTLVESSHNINPMKSKSSKVTTQINGITLETSKTRMFQQNAEKEKYSNSTKHQSTEGDLNNSRATLSEVTRSSPSLNNPNTLSRSEKMSQTKYERSIKSSSHVPVVTQSSKSLALSKEGSVKLTQTQMKSPLFTTETIHQNRTDELEFSGKSKKLATVDHHGQTESSKEKFNQSGSNVSVRTAQTNDNTTSAPNAFVSKEGETKLIDNQSDALCSDDKLNIVSDSNAITSESASIVPINELISSSANTKQKDISNTQMSYSNSSAHVGQKESSTKVSQSEPSTTVSQPKAYTNQRSKDSVKVSQSEASTNFRKSKASTNNIQSDVSLKVSQSEASTNISQSEASTNLSQSTVTAEVNQSECPLKVSQSEVTANVRPLESSPKVSQSEVFTYVGQSEASTNVSHSDVSAKLNQSETSTNVTQSGTNVNQSEASANVNRPKHPDLISSSQIASQSDYPLSQRYREEYENYLNNLNNEYGQERSNSQLSILSSVKTEYSLVSQGHSLIVTPITSPEH